jgi:hypothetical protein
LVIENLQLAIELLGKRDSIANDQFSMTNSQSSAPLEPRPNAEIPPVKVMCAPFGRGCFPLYSAPISQFPARFAEKTYPPPAARHRFSAGAAIGRG